MKYLLLSILIFFVACSVKTIPLKGSYPQPPMTYYSSKQIDSVWSNLIDFVSQKGVAIKIIDRSSGLIITEDYSFNGLIAYELKGGKISKDSAYVITSLLKQNGKVIGPDETKGNWNVRIKPHGNGTQIAVNITNIKTFNYYMDNRKRETHYDVKTLGVFEKMIFDYIK